jgi:hypothetical protein
LSIKFKDFYRGKTINQNPIFQLVVRGCTTRGTSAYQTSSYEFVCKRSTSCTSAQASADSSRIQEHTSSYVRSTSRTRFENKSGAAGRGSRGGRGQRAAGRGLQEHTSRGQAGFQDNARHYIDRGEKPEDHCHQLSLLPTPSLTSLPQVQLFKFILSPPAHAGYRVWGGLVAILVPHASVLDP